MLLPINITGGTYKHKSLALSAQVTQNFWPQAQQENSTKSSYILESFPGLKLFGTIAGTRDRGMFTHQDVLYKITDTTLYSVDSAGTHTSLGEVPGVARCIIDGIGSNIVITTEGTAYEWDGATITTGTDVDFETPNACTHLNNQMLYDGDGGRFGVSDVGAALTINGLNYATAESKADELLRPYVHDQIVHMMGTETIEGWWNSGVGNPPFDRIEGSIQQVGLGALHSVASSDDFVYFLGHNNQAYALSNSQAVPISTQAIAREFSSYSLVSDAHGACFNIDGQWFWRLSFPTAEKTFIYPEGGEWFQLSSGTDGGTSIQSSYAFAHRKHLVGDTVSGNIYELDPDTYTENGAPMVRIRDTGPLHGGLFGQDGKDIEINRFELILQTGVGELSGQGLAPVVMLSVSTDGGNTFGAEMWGGIGRSGKFQHKVEWGPLGSAESWILRVRTSDPVYYSLHSAAADIEFGI